MEVLSSVRATRAAKQQRDAEWEQWWHGEDADSGYWDRDPSRESDPSAFVILGPAGSGKTTTVQVVMDQAVDLGAK
eukprot:7946869-Karenia_brevis.AAC.1